jgi:predicted Fe-Mo cluster-binding NifX family protein
MKVAVLLFRDQVSPRFGASSMALVAEIERGLEVSRRLVELHPLWPEEIPGHLAERGVQTLICGGIHPRFQALLAARGIEVIGGIVGPAEMALERFRRGELRAGPFVRLGRAGRGGRGGRRRRRRGRGGPS